MKVKEEEYILCSFKECMLKNSFNSSKSLNYICSIVVQVPQLPIMSLMCPPERILFKNLVLFKISPYPPSFVICKGVTILLEQSIYSRYPTVPRILQTKSAE